MNSDELFWDDLLLYLEQRQVIPIIGQDLLTVEIDGKSVNAYRLMAERLAAGLKVSPETPPARFHAQPGEYGPSSIPRKAQYFYRGDVDFWDSQNRLVTLVLVFDQFEERFTLGRQSADIDA
jgi:hypothetical protein